MRIYYSFFLFLIFTHTLLISTPTCHITFDQKQSNSHSTFHHQKPFYYNHFYDQTNNLFNYSATDLQQHFNYHHYSEKEILSQNTLYLSDEFVKLVKTYPEYEKTITKLHKKNQRLWGIQKSLNYIIHGLSYSKYVKRINHLYNEIRSYKQLVTQNAKSFAHLYDIHLLALFPHDGSVVTKNIYKNYINILERAHLIPSHNSVVRDCIGKASSIGLEANKNGHTRYARQLADFCLTILDCVAAFGEGIYLGTKNSIATITHPIETIKNSLIYIGIVTHALSKLISVPVELVFLYIAEKDRFYIQKNNILNQLEMISNTANEYVKTTPKRDIIKQTSAFVAESIIVAKIFTFAHSLSKQLLPIAHHYFEYITKNEPAACLANGATISINPGPIFRQNKTPLNTIKKVFSEITISADVIDGLLIIDHPVINNIRTGSALKLDAHHSFPDIIDNFVRYAKKFDIKGNDGLVREFYQIEGSLNGIPGIFEWIVDPRTSRGVTHRIFIKNGKITGLPNNFARS